MHVQVMLEYFYPWTNSAGIYMARQRGWYAAEGLDVECRTYDPFRGDSLEYISRGEVSFALFPSNRLLVRREAGHPVIGIAAINHRGMEVVQTVTGKGIARPRDLSDKRIALNPTPRGLAMVHHLIEQDGGNPAFEVVDSGVREWTPEDIAAGKADATFGSYWAWEVLLESSILEEQRMIWPVDTIGAPLYHSYILGTNEQFLKQHPELVRAFLRATEKGYRAVADRPEAAVPIYDQILPYFPQNVISRSLPLIAATWFFDSTWGTQRRELLEPYAAWLHKYGILRDPSIWQQAVTNDFLTIGTSLRTETNEYRSADTIKQ